MLRVRFVMWLSLAWCAGGFWAAWASFVHMVDNAGGPATLAERLGMALFLVVLSAAFPIAMELYARSYVVRVEVTADSAWRRYTTVRWWGERREWVREDAHGRLTWHEGRFHLRDSTGRFASPRVDAPYSTQSVRRRRLPYILDEQGLWLGTRR